MRAIAEKGLCKDAGHRGEISMIPAFMFLLCFFPVYGKVNLSEYSG